MYDWIELTKLWEVERVTTEQVIGQLINHGEAQHRTLVALQRRQEQMEQAIAGLTVRVTQLEGHRASVRRPKSYCIGVDFDCHL